MSVNVISTAGNTGTGFLDLANPKFNLRGLIKTSDTDLLFADDFRSILVEQPKLSSNERIPASMALQRGEIALSLMQFPESFFVTDIDLYATNRHELIADLLVKEIDDTETDTTHGTYDTYKLGCRGPMCRRAIRQERATAEALRRARTDARTGKSAHTVRPNNWKDRVRRAAPQYAAIDPITVAFTVFAHRLIPPPRPTAESKKYMRLETNKQLYDFLKAEYIGFGGIVK